MKKISKIPMVFFAFSTLAMADLESDMKQMKQEMNQLKKRVENTEYEALSNTMKFNGQLENRYDYTNVDDKTDRDQNSNVGLYSSFFRLNMNSKPADNVEFFGRISMAKFWNDTYANGTRPDQSQNNATSAAGRIRSSPGLFVERAFVNWEVMPNWIFTAGRLPSIDGGPKHFSMGTAAMGSYPNVAFSRIFDGAALTHKIAGNDWNMKFRVIYSPYQIPNFSNLTTNLTTTATFGPSDIKQKSDLVTLNSEYEVMNLGFAKRFNTILQILYTELYSVPGANSSNVVQGDLKVKTNSGTWYSEVNNLFDLDLDLYVSLKYTMRHSNGSFYDSANRGGYFSGSGNNPYHGTNAWAGFRKKFLGENYFGAEYVNNSDQQYSPDSAFQDLINFYGTPASNGIHTYATRHFNNVMTGIIGYTRQHIKKSYYNGLYGAPVHANTNTDSFYVRLIANF